MGAVALVSAGLFSSACSEATTAATQLPAVTANPDQVVAEVAGKPITLKVLTRSGKSSSGGTRPHHQAMLPEPPQHARPDRRRSPDRERRQGRRPVGRRIRGRGLCEAPARHQRSGRGAILRAEQDRAQAGRSTSCAAKSSPSSRRVASCRPRDAGRRVKTKNAGAVKVMLEAPRYRCRP